MATPTVVYLAVSPTVPGSSTPAKKRKITPSAEQFSPKRILILTTPGQKHSDISSPGTKLLTQPFFAPKQLFPHGAATVVGQRTHSHPSPKKEEESTALWPARHVLLPFNLRDSTIDIEQENIQSLLSNIFPGTYNVAEARHRSHLLFQVEKIPRGPWPLTVGGLPFTVIDDNGLGRALMLPKQNLGNFNISLCQEGYSVDTFSDQALRKLAAEVYDKFRKNLPEVGIVELIFTCERTFYVILEDHVNIGTLRWRLPGKIVNCPTGYLNNKELCRPLWADLTAKRHVEPQPTRGTVDNTVYDTLRPGVMICSKMLKEHRHPAVFSTTSGVLVKNPAGDRFMTGASRGIGPSETIWQAANSEKIIGKAAVEITFTDISLIELSNDVEFVNETFESNGGVVPHFTRLTTSNDKLDWSICQLNSPYTGSMEGSIVMKSIKFKKSTHPTQDRLSYVVYDWAFMGQEESNENRVRPPEGTCGSVIWNGDGVILGFYQYYIDEGNWAGFSASVSASEVVEAGYSLAT